MSHYVTDCLNFLLNCYIAYYLFATIIKSTSEAKQVKAKFLIEFRFSDRI